jgi:hypothetical protein
MIMTQLRKFDRRRSLTLRNVSEQITFDEMFVLEELVFDILFKFVIVEICIFLSIEPEIKVSSDNHSTDVTISK